LPNIRSKSNGPSLLSSEITSCGSVDTFFLLSRCDFKRAAWAPFAMSGPLHQDFCSRHHSCWRVSFIVGEWVTLILCWICSNIKRIINIFSSSIIVYSNSATNIARCSIRQQEIEWERKSLPVSSSKIEKLHMLKGELLLHLNHTWHFPHLTLYILFRLLF